MEGVEATPEPSLGPEAGGGPSDSNEAPPAMNGKSVAFIEGDEDGEEENGEVAEGNLLSREDLQDARLRRSASSSPDVCLAAPLTFARSTIEQRSGPQS